MFLFVSTKTALLNSSGESLKGCGVMALLWRLPFQVSRDEIEYKVDIFKRTYGFMHAQDYCSLFVGSPLHVRPSDLSQELYMHGTVPTS